MKSIVKALAWISLGAVGGASAVLLLAEAGRRSVPERASLAPAEPAPVAVLPEPEPEPPPAPPPEPPPPPPPPAAPPPPPRPALEFFGFGVESGAAAPEPPPRPPEAPPPPPPPPAPRMLSFAPMKDRAVAGFDATSTLHDFRGWTKSVQGSLRFEKDRLEETAEARFVVDARTLDTNNPDRDAEMHQDFLETQKHPEFVFTLSEFRREDGGRFRMKGVLEIHGRKKDVEATGSFELRRSGHLHAKGEMAAKMSDFGISPPVTALIIRVGDEIRVWFELWAEPVKEEKP